MTDTTSGIIRSLHTLAQVRNMLQTLERPGSSPLTWVGQVAKLSATPASIVSPPPSLGEQTLEIMAHDFGYSSLEIDNLFFEKVVLENQIVKVGMLLF